MGFLACHRIRQLDSFLDRKSSKRLVVALRADDDRTVALVGMGGAGKSVLAVKAAHDRQVQNSFPDGVVWLEVNQQRDIVTLQTRLARRLGDTSPQFTNSKDGGDVLARLLADRHVLLILDNVWDREALDAFTDLAPGCTVLFTSRHSQFARDLDAVNLEISALTLDQALALLARWTDGRSTLRPSWASTAR